VGFCHLIRGRTEFVFTPLNRALDAAAALIRFESAAQDTA
jgi:hypothetical protein